MGIFDKNKTAAQQADDIQAQLNYVEPHIQVYNEEGACVYDSRTSSLTFAEYRDTEEGSRLVAAAYTARGN